MSESRIQYTAHSIIPIEGCNFWVGSRVRNFLMTGKGGLGDSTAHVQYYKSFPFDENLSVQTILVDIMTDSAND